MKKSKASTIGMAAKYPAKARTFKFADRCML
jgi:hypothetical protein